MRKTTKVMVVLGVILFLSGIMKCSMAKDKRVDGSKYIMLKWTQEKLGEIGNMKVSNDVIYVEAASDEGPKLYAIDIKSGKVLGSKSVNPGYRLRGVSKKAIYLARGDYFEVFDRIMWKKIWGKKIYEPRSLWIFECGLIYEDDDRDDYGYYEFVSMLDEATGKPLWKFRTFDGPKQCGEDFFFTSYDRNKSGRYINPKFYRLSLVDGKISVTTRKFCPDGWYLVDKIGNNFWVIVNFHKIGLLDMNSGQIKWEKDLEIPIWAPIVDTINGVVIIFSHVEHGDTAYTLWYGINTTDGKTRWKKWAKENSSELYGVKWSEIVNGLLLIGKRKKLILMDTLTGEILTQQEISVSHRDIEICGDMVIIRKTTRLKGYQIKR